MPFCKGLRPKIIAIVNKVDDVVNHYLTAAVGITGKLRSIINSPVADVITALIPGTWDDALKEQARAALSVTVNALTTVETIISEPDLNTKVQLFMAELAKQRPDLQEAMLFKIASLLLKAMHGDQLTQSEYDLITQAKVISLK